ncbi:MAG: PAS domain S-box protein [bacterium]
MITKFDIQREKNKILIMATLLVICCFLTYYFHVVLKSGTVFTHFFYIPIILASVWWQRKGLAVAVFLAVWLLLSHFLFRVGLETINDLIRAPMFIAVSLVAALLSEKLGKAEGGLRETRDYLDKLITYANAPIIVWNPDFRITRFNKAFERLTGYASGEVIGKELRLLFPEISRNESLGRIEQTAGGEFLKSVEIPILRKDGDARLALWNSANIYAEDGKTLVSTIAQGIDITERKLSEKAIAASKAYAESIIRNFLDTLIVVDPEAKIETVNPATCDLLGYTEEELLGQPVSIIFAAAAAEEVLRFFQFFLEPNKAEAFDPQNTVRNRELNYKTKDGRLIQMSFNASVLTDEAGNITGVVAGAKDITDIKRAEATIKKERNFSKNIITTVPESLLVVDKDLRIKSANRSFYETFKIEPENTIGASITDILGNDKGKLSAELKRLFGTEDMLENYELHYKSEKIDSPREARELTSQCERIFNVTARRIIIVEEEEEEEEEEELVVLRDITERKRAQEQIEASLSENDVLLREIHHRVKNNLQVISSILDMCRMRTHDQQAIDLFTDVRDKIHTMALIHSQLYRSNRVAQVNIGNHVREMVDYLSKVYVTNAKLITPVIEYSDIYLSVIQAIPCILALHEIISNAFKHAFKEDKGTIKIFIKRLDDDTVFIRIKDDGIGIPEEIDIYKTNSLGLKLLRSLVQKQLKGKIQINRNKGTEFIVEFKILECKEKYV